MIRSTDKPVPSARKLAYQALYEILEKKAYANLILQHMMREYSLSGPESRLLTELVYGVLRKYNYLLYVISRLSSYSLKKMHPSVRILLCLGLYQLLYLSRIPESAAVNEIVKIAKKITHRGNVGFINGLLRGYLRKKEEITLFPREEDPLLYDSLYWNEPEWLIRKWQSAYGEEEACRILKSLNETPRLTVRVNTLKNSREEFLSLLAEKKIKAESALWQDDALIITEGAHDFWPLAEAGLAYVQSLSSMIPARVLSPKAGEMVLDMCAAPGSKTTQMAETMENRGSIDAWDLYPHKISLIKNNAKKLGISIIHAGARDSSKPFPALYGKYDKVLLDAPCSGLGVLSHKPEIRWHRKEEDLNDFPPLQESLLSCAASYVKKGGTLVYSTCTLNPAENEDMVRRFLACHREFKPVDFTLYEGKSSKEGMMTILPYELQSDGFFVARLQKQSFC
ncbi:16S rRNA (cytosine(967)-C(5))-methyltransferase RsmB [uncultured Dialister sp.]|uniref:16S rRNA (cytosine(967)-C(5))-methyltransferase RsmB n=1 Tax=uncultured Dialister sp. TaxID=278064 RepID=UPI0025CF5C2A|nr:16S rRNA (cytosine(967)-C(5))-methyltransferase RsmB [uncultured Dialister sp.]